MRAAADTPDTPATPDIRGAAFARTLACILVAAATAAAAAEGGGTISGVVSDEATGRLLAGARVKVEAAAAEATADEDGYFLLAEIPPGGYVLKVFMMGYRPRAVADVIVKPGRRTTVNVTLEQAVIEGAAVIRAESYFAQPSDVTVSAHSLSSEEIRRQPGGAGDIQRVLSTMPGVGASDVSSELVVRGGDPDENLFVVDNVEIYNPVHYGRVYGAEGAISALNLQLIDRVDFYAGGFPAQYGDRLSAAMDLTLRDGDRGRYSGTGDISMSGATALAEGPLGERASFIVAGRQSLLQLLSGITDFGTGGAVPRYYDSQGKVSWDVTPAHRLSAIGFWAADRISLPADSGIAEAGGAGVEWYADQGAFGGTWRWLYSDAGVATLTLSRAGNYWNYRTANGDAGVHARQYEYTARAEVSRQLAPFLKVTLGGRGRRVELDHRLWDAGGFTATGQPIGAQDLRLGLTSYKNAAFAEAVVRAGAALTFVAGGRGDYFAYTREAAVAPRLGAKLRAGERTTFRAAAGRYYQTPAYADLALNAYAGGPPLAMARADHYIAGATHLVAPDAEVGVEGYYKKLRRLTVHVVDEGRELVRSSGVGRAYGGEIYFHKKLARRYFARGAYSWGRSRRAPRAGAPLAPSDYDQTHTFTVIAGVEPWESWLFSAKFKVATNRPYTPIVGRWELPYRAPGEGPRWFRVDGAANSERYPLYHRLDVRVDKRFAGKGWNLVTYFDLQNAYDRKNVIYYKYTSDYTSREPVYAWSLMPVGGVEFSY